MKKSYITSLILLSFLLTSCATARKPVPIGTIPEAKTPTVADEQYGHQAFGELTKKHPLDYDHPRYNELQEIVKKLTHSINADKDPWHIYLLKADGVKNAGATRGNHIFVWTGMLNYTQNEDELASIMAHEIAHVLARHTDADEYEKIRKTLIGIGSMAAGIAVASTTGIGQIGQITTQLSNKVGEGFFLNPYSQTKENEADQIGLFLMAKAKYDPQAAVDFWQRASNDSSFGSSLSFFSTHPSSAERMQRLTAMLPQARAAYLGQDFNQASQTETAQTQAEAQRITTQETSIAEQPLKSPVIQEPVERTNYDKNSVDSWDIRSQSPQ